MLEISGVAFVQGQSESQSSNTERLLFVSRKAPVVSPHVPQRQWREIRVLTFLHKVNQSVELLAAQPRECLVCDSCSASA